MSRPPPDRPPNHARKRFAKVNTMIDCTMYDLTRAELAVWLVLWRDTQPDGLARTGQADIARRAGVSVRAVHSAVRALAARGLLEVLRVGWLGWGPSVYRVRGVNPDAGQVEAGFRLQPAVSRSPLWKRASAIP